MLGDPRMSDAEPGTPLVTLTISPDTGLGFVLSRVEAVEELGRPFLITLDVSAKTPKGDLHYGTRQFGYRDAELTPRKPVRHFNGIIARVRYLGLTGGGLSLPGGAAALDLAALDTSRIAASSAINPPGPS